MLEKIKVYSRINGQEILQTHDDYFALVFKTNGEIWLQYRTLERDGGNELLNKVNIDNGDIKQFTDQRVFNDNKPIVELWRSGKYFVIMY